MKLHTTVGIYLDLFCKSMPGVYAFVCFFSESLDSSSEMAINIPVKEEKEDFSFEANVKVFLMLM